MVTVPLSASGPKGRTACVGERSRGARAGRLARLSGGQPGVLGQEVRAPHLRRRRLVNLRRSSAGSVMAEAGAQAGIATPMGRRRTKRRLDCCSCRPAIPPRRKRPPRRAGSIGARRHLAGRISTPPLCGRKRALGSGPGAIGARWPVGTGRPVGRGGALSLQHALFFKLAMPPRTYSRNLLQFRQALPFEPTCVSLTPACAPASAITLPALERRKLTSLRLRRCGARTSCPSTPG